MSKFKIGDVVRATTDSYHYANQKSQFIGIVIEVFEDRTFIAETISRNGYTHKTETFGGLIESDFELVRSDEIEEIKIKRLNNVVVAIVDNGDGTSKSSRVECIEKGKFDFMYAARLALHGLFEEKFTPKLMFGTKCMGTIGEPTNLKDKFGNPLKVGDVVAYTPKYRDVSEIDISLDFVVKGNSEPFVMGIRGDCKSNGEIVDWDVVKFKDCYEVKHGEQLSGIVAKLHAD